MTKSLTDYILSSEKEYEYRIKFATEPSPVLLENIAILLKEYDVFEIGDVYKSIFMDQPKDFDTCGEVWMVDVKTRRAFVPELFVRKISELTNYPLNLLRIRNKLEPAQQTVQPFEDGDMFDEYIVKLTDPEYTSDGCTGIDNQTLVGDHRSAEACKEIQKSKEKKYSNFMGAGFNYTNGKKE